MSLELHPFLKTFGAITLIPPQLVTLKEKYANKNSQGISNWMQQTLDALELIGRRQYIENQSMLINEKLVNGEFIPQDYFHDNDDETKFLEPVEQLIKEGKLPRFIKHYDIISKPINTEVQEFAELPDSFHVVGQGEKLMSERMQVQTQMLQDWLMDTYEQRFQRFLFENNIDPNQEFESPEEQQQFLMEIESLRQTKTPKEIGEYMKSDYRHIAELWAEYELQDQKQRFKLDKLRRQEFRDLLIHARRFRHLRVGYNGLEIETLNPINVFYHKSPNVEYIQKGDYAGTYYIATPSFIIDKFGRYMTGEQMKAFNASYNINWNVKPTKDFFGNPVAYADTNDVPYDTWLPTFNPTLNKLAPHLGFNYTPNLFGIGESAGYFNNQYYTVTEAYWKAFEKIYKLTWINPETGIFEVIEVDENFNFPYYIKKIENSPINDNSDLNTAVASWRSQLWQGIVIRSANYSTNIEPIYLNVKPCDYQRTSPYEVDTNLPIVGQILNNRNNKPSSQVDKLKPYQFLVNVAMNKVAKLQERGYLPYVVMDMNLIPNQGDWGGKDAVIKWLEAGQQGINLPIDASPSNTQGAAQTGGQYPRVIDIDISARLVSQLEIARGLIMMGYDQIGITPSRLGDVKGIDSATGITTSVAKSHLATGSIFTEFWEAEALILQQQLNIAQKLEAENKDITKEFVRSDFTTGFLKFANNNFNLYDLRLYVSNSQEELRKKKLYQDLALSNNTVITDMSTRMEMLDTMTPSERIIQLVKQAEEKAEQRERELFELRQQELQAQDEQEKARLQQQYDLKIKEFQKDLQEAWIKSRGYLGQGEQDIDNSNIPDAFEYEKFQTQANNQFSNLGLNRDKLAFEREKEQQRIKEKQADINLKQQELNLKNKQVDQTAKNVRILDKGKYNGK